MRSIAFEGFPRFVPEGKNDIRGFEHVPRQGTRGGGNEVVVLLSSPAAQKLDAFATNGRTAFACPVAAAAALSSLVARDGCASLEMPVDGQEQPLKTAW